jgi:hypothetical protein
MSSMMLALSRIRPAWLSLLRYLLMKSNNVFSPTMISRLQIPSPLKQGPPVLSFLQLPACGSVKGAVVVRVHGPSVAGDRGSRTASMSHPKTVHIQAR